MEFRESEISGCSQVLLKKSSDFRGSFLKFFQQNVFSDGKRLPFEVREAFCSASHAGVIRGLHFQNPPHDHHKLVVCLSGRVKDVVLDLRISSSSYGKTASFDLSGEAPGAVLIPTGCAHGFQALEDHSVLLYLTSREHSPDHDTGIRWNSVGINWPLENQMVSERDRGFVSWADFRSPFP